MRFKRAGSQEEFRGLLREIAGPEGSAKEGLEPKDGRLR